MFNHKPVTEWEVLLDSIPFINEGIEVVVEFRSFDIKNKNTFYTDSNGLEM